MSMERAVKAILLCRGTRLRLLLQERLEALGITTSSCEDGGDFLSLLKRNNFDVALTVMGKGESDLEFVFTLCSSRPGLPVLVLALDCRIEDAVKIMQAGAEDLILEPWDEDILKDALKRAVINFPLRKRRGGARRRGGMRDIVCKSPQMLKLLKIAKNIAPTRASVLIQGESGTGKELLARFIHQESDRSDGPFVAINCASLPDTLLESELFGHEKGAFTGAISRKKGKFELADKGTILLDEITEMAFPLQAKLLRVLQEGEVDRLGGTGSVPIDVRVIATTNRDIKEAIKDGNFREDLYYRLNVIPLTLPPLRERADDIEILSMHFLKEFRDQYGKDGLDFAKDVIDELKTRPWQGNVRELRNIIERGVLLAPGDEIRLEDLFFDEVVDAPGQTSGRPGVDLGETFNLQEVEREVIRRALLRTEGNRTHAARLLGISVRTLRNKIAEYREMGLVL